MSSVIHCLDMQEGKVIRSSDERFCCCFSLCMQGCSIVSCVGTQHLSISPGERNFCLLVATHKRPTHAPVAPGACRCCMPSDMPRPAMILVGATTQADNPCRTSKGSTWILHSHNTWLLMWTSLRRRSDSHKGHALTSHLDPQPLRRTTLATDLPASALF